MSQARGRLIRRTRSCKPDARLSSASHGPRPARSSGPRRPGVTQFAGPDAGPRPPGPVFVREDPPGPVFVREDPPGPVFVREDPLGPVFVCEDPPGSGPVAALAAALPEVTAPLTLLLAADLPFLTARALAPLPSACDGAPDAVLADDGGRPQWLASCWRTAALRGALAGYRGRSLHGLLEPLRPVLLACPAAPGEPPPWLDCDTAEDLARARRLARGKERHA